MTAWTRKHYLTAGGQRPLDMAGALTAGGHAPLDMAGVVPWQCCSQGQQVFRRGGLPDKGAASVESTFACISFDYFRNTYICIAVHQSGGCESNLFHSTPMKLILKDRPLQYDTSSSEAVFDDRMTAINITAVVRCRQSTPNIFR